MTRHGESGSTLLEVLVAMLILALTATAILSMLTTSISGSAIHRGISEMDSLLSDYAESATYTIELQGSSAYLDCNEVPSGYQQGGEQTVVSWYNKSIAATAPVTVPANYSVMITAVAPWDTSTNAYSTGQCTAAETGSVGVQQLTITATAPDQQTRTLVVVVRDPSDVDARATF